MRFLPLRLFELKRKTASQERGVGLSSRSAFFVFIHLDFC